MPSGRFRLIWLLHSAFCYKRCSNVSDGSGVNAPVTVFFCADACLSGRCMDYEGQ